MPFEPATNLLKFARGPQLEAWRALEARQPETPFTGRLHAYPVHELLPFKEAHDQVAHPRGPIAPTATCPVTGRQLSLRVFRDLSAIILREGEDQGAEALPAVLVLPSSSYAQGFKEIPYHARGEIAGRLDLQARAEGIFFDLMNAQASDQEIADLIGTSMREAAGEILSAPPVADPRAHLDPPEGSRFAPHAAFPQVDPEDSRLLAFNKILIALGALRCVRQGSLSHDIQVFRELPGEPWRQPSSSAVHTHEGRAKERDRRDKDLDKLIRRLLNDPQIAPPLCYRHGPECQMFTWLKKIHPPTSNHEAMAHHQVLHGLTGRHNITPLLAGSKGGT